MLEDMLRTTHGLIATFILTLYISLCSGQQYKLYKPNLKIHLVNSLDTTKQIKIREKSSYGLSYDEPITDSATEYNRHYITGYISTIDETSINFINGYERTYLKLKNHPVVEDYISGRKMSGDTLLGTYRNIKINNINYLSYTPTGRGIIRIIGTDLMVLSTCTLIISPLFGINKSGYNINRFLTVAGIGLGGLCIGIPIHTAMKPKKYKISEKGAKKEKEYWYLETPLDSKLKR